MKIKILNMIWALASAMLFSKFVCDNTLRYSNSMLPIVVLITIYMFLKKGSQTGDKRKAICTHILGFLFASMISMGYSLDVNKTVFFAWQPICVILYTHNIAVLLGLLWTFLEKANEKLNNSSQNRRVYIIFRYPILIWTILVLCWVPVFLADFPGGFRYDAMIELAQRVDGYNGNMPLLHSLIVTRLIPFMYGITGSWNAGIVVYVIIQMVLSGIMYTNILRYLYKRGINKDLLFMLLVICGGFPVIQMLVVQEVRDVMFSLLLTYTIFLIYVMVKDKNYFWGNIRYPLKLGIFIILTIYARNNNTGIVMPIILIGVVITISVINIKKYAKGVMIFAGSSLVLYVAMGVLLAVLCQPYNKASSLTQSLSVMTQPLVRAYVNNDDWTAEEISELEKYYDLDTICYYPENADYTKNNLKLSNNFGEFFKFWCKIGAKHPRDYVDGILATSQNMWFPASVVDGYNKSGVEGYKYGYDKLDKCYLYIGDYVEYPAIHRSYWPSLLKFYTNLGVNLSFEKVPVISMMFSIGFWFWFVLNLVFYLIYRKDKKMLCLVGIILIYMLISSFVPLVLLRYYAAVFLAIPLLIVFTLQPEWESNEVKMEEIMTEGSTLVNGVHQEMVGKP